MQPLVRAWLTGDVDTAAQPWMEGTSPIGVNLTKDHVADTIKWLLSSESGELLYSREGPCWPLSGDAILAQAVASTSSFCFAGGVNAQTLQCDQGMYGNGILGEKCCADVQTAVVPVAHILERAPFAAQHLTMAICTERPSRPLHQVIQ